LHLSQDTLLVEYEKWQPINSLVSLLTNACPHFLHLNIFGASPSCVRSFSLNIAFNNFTLNSLFSNIYNVFKNRDNTPSFSSFSYVNVKRILLKKIKYDLIDNYEASTSDINVMLNDHQELSYKFAKESITLVKGNFEGLDKNKSTLIVSPEASFSLGTNLDSNSFASYAKSYLEKNGYRNIKSYTVAKNISSADSSTIINEAKSYDQIVIAMSNGKTSNYSRTISFVNSLASLNKKLVVIALDTPYDIMAYSDNVETYICCYSYQEVSCKALARYLSGEFEAQGVLPITEGLK
jgi:ADP-heptose:LPS heptosyltransferase